jgi:hypothetical protein
MRHAVHVPLRAPWRGAKRRAMPRHARSAAKRWRFATSYVVLRYSGCRMRFHNPLKPLFSIVFPSSSDSPHNPLIASLPDAAMCFPVWLGLARLFETPRKKKKKLIREELQKGLTQKKTRTIPKNTFAL